LFADLTAVVASNDSAGIGELRKKYGQEAERYKGEQKEIEDEARKLENEVATERNRADRYDLGEVFLEVGLVITSITLLSGRRVFWSLGIVMGVVGTVVAVTGFLVR